MSYWLNNHFQQGSLMQGTRRPEAPVVRIIKCLGPGCPIRTICPEENVVEFDTKTGQTYLVSAKNQGLPRSY